MTEQNELQPGLHLKSLGKRALQGAGIAFVVITLFFFGDGGEWN